MAPQDSGFNKREDTRNHAINEAYHSVPVGVGLGGLMLTPRARKLRPSLRVVQVALETVELLVLWTALSAG